tara:strand:- start:67 stop:495 length:429 start_codon:yes stop_codon:yes gene_type:complete
MKEYGKWLVVGLLIGAGISMGFRASDYFINTYIIEPSREPSTVRQQYPSDIEITNPRIVAVPFSYQVSAKLNNNSNIQYVRFEFTVELHDDGGALDICEGFSNARGKKEVQITLHCNISSEKHPSVSVKNLEVISGSYYEST